MSSRPLKGIRVLDFSWVGAGTYATRMLADHGADVIKVESMRRPDQTRLTPPFKDRVAGVNRSGYFADRNTSKRSLALNIATHRGREIALKLMEHSDIVANNFRPGTMRRLGLGYEEATKVRKDIIFVEMSMQGGEGPHSGFLGYGLTIGALSGLHGLSRLTTGEPAGTGTNYPDHVPSPGHAVVAILAALRHRRRTGEGQHIDISQVAATVSSIGVALVGHATTGRTPRSQSNESPAVRWQGVLPCARTDRWIAISILDDGDWASLDDILGTDLDGEHFPIREADRVNEVVSEKTRDWDAWELMHALQQAGVAAGVVQHAGDLMERDPQLAHRGHFVQLAHKEMGDTVYNVLPFRLLGTPSPLERPAPMLGEHTIEVLRDVLGFHDDECQRLAEEGVLA